MPQIQVTIRDDKALEGVAPIYLKGRKAVARRVQWAILEVVRAKRSNKELTDGEKKGTIEQIS